MIKRSIKNWVKKTDDWKKLDQKIVLEMSVGK